MAPVDQHTLSNVQDAATKAAQKAKQLRQKRQQEYQHQKNLNYQDYLREIRPLDQQINQLSRQNDQNTPSTGKLVAGGLFLFLLALIGGPIFLIGSMFVLLAATLMLSKGMNNDGPDKSQLLQQKAQAEARYNEKQIDLDNEHTMDELINGELLGGTKKRKDSPNDNEHDHVKAKKQRIEADLSVPPGAAVPAASRPIKRSSDTGHGSATRRVTTFPASPPPPPPPPPPSTIKELLEKSKERPNSELITLFENCLSELHTKEDIETFIGETQEDLCNLLALAITASPTAPAELATINQIDDYCATLDLPEIVKQTILETAQNTYAAIYNSNEDKLADLLGIARPDASTLAFTPSEEALSADDSCQSILIGVIILNQRMPENDTRSLKGAKKFYYEAALSIKNLMEQGQTYTEQLASRPTFSRLHHEFTNSLQYKLADRELISFFVDLSTVYSIQDEKWYRTEELRTEITSPGDVEAFYKGMKDSQDISTLSGQLTKRTARNLEKELQKRSSSFTKRFINHRMVHLKPEPDPYAHQHVFFKRYKEYYESPEAHWHNNEHLTNMSPEQLFYFVPQVFQK